MQPKECLEMEANCQEVFSTEFWKVFAPETILLVGLLLIFIIPNLGNSKFRIPLTKVKYLGSLVERDSS